MLLCNLNDIFFFLENQSQIQQQNHSKPLDDTSGEILNNTGNLEIQQANRHLTCNFR